MAKSCQNRKADQQERFRDCLRRKILEINVGSHIKTLNFIGKNYLMRHNLEVMELQ